MCLTPQRLRNGTDVPCGKCAECIIAYRNAWVCRILAESQYYDGLYFVTLTYSDENLVYGDDEYAILNFEDVQKYFKKLRKAGLSFKYFAVGEYGERSKRPHYHVIFMLKETCDINVFDEKWVFGGVHIMNAGNGNIRYATKDMLKFVGDETRFKAQFRVSKGMGMSFCEKHKAWYVSDLDDRHKVYVFGDDFVMPRYMKLKIYSQGERDYKNFNYGVSRTIRDRISSLDKQALRKAREKAKYSVIEAENKLREVKKVRHFNKKL